MSPETGAAPRGTHAHRVDTAPVPRRRAPGMPGRNGAVRWAIGLVLVGAVLLRFDVEAVVARLGQADLRLVLPALAGLVAVHALGAATWRSLTRILNGPTLGWREALHAYYVGQGIGGLTPANLGSDVYRAWATHGQDGGWRGAVAPIAVQRITSSLALVALGASGAAWLGATGVIAPIAGLGEGPEGPPLVAIGAGALLAGAILASALVAAWLAWRRLRIATDVGTGGSDPGAAPTRRLPAAVTLGLLLGLAFHALSVLLVMLLVLALTPVSSPIAVVAALAVGRLAILVPIAPSGLGVQEGTLAVLFLRIGLPVEVALAAAVLNRVALGVTVALAVILLQREPDATTRRQPGDDRRPGGDGRRVDASSTVADTPDIRRLTDGAQDPASSSRITASDAA
jgi:uncharacterized membrane protein YbhN (UPF0104 family)